MKVTTFVANNSFDAINEQIKLVGKGIDEGIEQFVVVPDRFSLSAERLIMEKLGLVASFDFQVVSLSRLANLVLGKKFGKKVLSMLDAVMIVQFLIKKNKDKFVCFSSIPITTTFAQSLFDSISQIKSCKITPIMLKNSVESLKDGNLKNKMQDIALVYELYENYISENFVDSNSKIGLLCEKLKSSQIFDGKDVHFCNFQDFTAQDFDVIKNSIKCARSVSITVKCPTKNQPNEDLFLLDTTNELKSLFEELNITPEIVACENTQTKVNSHITKNLFCLEPCKVSLANNEVCLFGAENLEEEVVFVAKKILWLLGHGEKLSNIVLNVCDLNAYEGVLQNVFQRYEIPFWIDQDVGLEATEFFKLLSSLFDVLKFGYQTDDVLKFVFNGLSGLDFESKQNFDFYAKKFGLVGTLWTKPLKLKNVDEKLKEFDTNKLNFMKSVQNFEKDVKNSAKLKDFCDALKTFVADFGLEKKCEELSLFFEEKGNLKQSSIFRQCFEKFEKILEQISLVLGEEESSFDEFCEMFEVCSKASKMVPIPMGTNNVFVGQMLSSLFEPKPYVFVLGATEGRLPAFMKDVGIISDTDIKLLSGIDINPTIEKINKKTIVTIIENLSLAQKQLAVSYPRNIKSTENQPSQVFASLKQMFDLDVVSISDYLNNKNIFKTHEDLAEFLFPTKRDFLFWFFKQFKENLEDEKVKQFVKFFEEELKSYDINLKPKQFVSNAKDLFFTKGFTSVSQIETFFDCPLKHFMRYGLKLKEKQLSKVDSKNIGNILHAIVEKFGAFSNDKTLTEKEIEEFAEKTFDEICENEEYERFLVDPQNKILMNGLKVESKRVCKAIYYQNEHSKYKIKFIEAVFGDKNFAPQMAILLTGSKKVLRVSGKVDRVDFYGSKFRVVDYKTGNNQTKFDLIDLYIGHKIQLYIYMKAIFDGIKDVLPTGAFYYPINNEYLKTAPNFPFQNYCMNGVTIGDIENFFDQDSQVSFSNPTSPIIGFSLRVTKELENKDEYVLKNDAKLVSENQLLRMMDYSKKVMSGAIDEILEGYVEPKPLKESCLRCFAQGFCPMRKQSTETIRKTNFDVTKETFEETLKDE